ncbi:Calcium-binding protein 8 [Sciurus carolinensis]|uniref:Calcium-binding protein 8 n=1 Tax=Sciurus carolinensis TaxID=30640 RepID=A0AA41MVQ7_SCICA|nr:Calcium-binding protein 8 [Sciurus carolinensis]
MPFHHVTAGLLYKGNYLNRSLSAGSDSEQLANISVEELDGLDPAPWPLISLEPSDARGPDLSATQQGHCTEETYLEHNQCTARKLMARQRRRREAGGSPRAGKLSGILQGRCQGEKTNAIILAASKCYEKTEPAEIREAFRVLDRDGNGFISKQELGMAMRSLGYMPSEVELAIIMQRLDMDGDGQVDFDEFMTILGPKLVSSEGRDGFLGNTIDSIFWQFDMQRMTLEELKHILHHAFRDHLTMKDIENIIINEEESLNETSGNCQTEFEGVHSQKQNRQTCVRKSLICAFAMAFIISVMLIAANQILRSGME